MQQAVAATAIIVNDIGLLTADQVPAFRDYLVSIGVEVRDAGAGQFCHVRLPGAARWLPIERGRADAPVTPSAIRELVCDFHKKTLNEGPARRIAAAAGNMQLTQISSFQGEANDSRLALSTYLSDLRDDLALHAPLVQLANESLHAFAIRRWEYADLMLATRTTKAGD